MNIPHKRVGLLLGIGQGNAKGERWIFITSRDIGRHLGLCHVLVDLTGNKRANIKGGVVP